MFLTLAFLLLICVSQANASDTAVYFTSVSPSIVSDNAAVDHLTINGDQAECSFRCLQHHCYHWVYDKSGKQCSIYTVFDGTCTQTEVNGNIESLMNHKGKPK